MRQSKIKVVERESWSPAESQLK